MHELFHGTPAATNPMDQEPAEWPTRSHGTGTAPESFPTWAQFWAEVDRFRTE